MKKSSIICRLAMVSLYAFLFIYACGGSGDGSAAGIGSGDNPSSGGDSGDGLSSNSGTSEFATDTGAKLLIEHNATDEYTGFQGFTGGDQIWYELTISDPQGQRVMTVRPESGLVELGLTELFFKTWEPLNDEVPLFDVLTRLPEGDYAFVFNWEFWDYWGYSDDYSAKLTHTIPADPVLITPADDSTVDPDNLIVSWESVNEDINGVAVNLVGYQVNVEKDEEPQFPQGFSRSLFSVHVPAMVTSVTVPREFVENNACYKYNVLAIEESGNQTISSAMFGTQ